MLTLCLVVVMLAVLFSGCMKMHADIIWKEDNSGTLSMTVGMTNSAMSMMGTTTEDMQEQLKTGFLEDEEGYTIEGFSDEEYTGIIATTRIADITTDVTNVSDQLSFIYTDKDNKKTYTVSGNYDGAASLGDNSSFEDSGLSLADIDMKISITMPGQITSHNATEQEGNKLIWDMTSASTTAIQATSEINSGGGVMLWVFIGLGVLILIGLGIAFSKFSRQKKDPQDF